MAPFREHLRSGQQFLREPVEMSLENCQFAAPDLRLRNAFVTFCTLLQQTLYLGYKLFKF
jgi:hypothetical protein